MKKRRALISVFIIAFMLCIPFSIRRNIPDPAERGSDHAAEQAAAELEKQLSLHASVTWVTNCMGCGHTYSFSDASSVIGFTRDELASSFPEWSIKSFTREYALLERNIEGYCPEHFLLFYEQKRLSVYTVTEPWLKLEKLMSFDPSPYLFTEDELDELKNGAAFNSLIELDRYTDKHKKR